MALKAIFIGINRYSDSTLHDLTGARPDAVALEALFTDCVPCLEATLILDEVATRAATTRVLEETLVDAASDDQVLVFFSGHGSRTNHLVFHDSTVDQVDTMLAMADFADLFKSSSAKSVLGVLDCCFSGEAPARVVSEGPRPRGPALDLGDLFTGKGRMLIAASSPTEPAWEHPGKGHGFLTKAIMDVLRAAEDHVELGTATDDIIRTVQAEAKRYGLTQTPTFVNFAEGGLRLPALRPGPKFAAAFPERCTAPVSNDLQDLSRFQISQGVIDAWRSRFSGGLNELQLKAVNEHGVLHGRGLLTVAPTGAGKTFIGEMAAIRAVSDDRRAVFLLPYKALVNEKYEEFRELYGGTLDLRVIRCTGDYQDQTSAFVRGKYDIALLTYEMFLSLAVAMQSTLHHIGLVVVDEAQFITDPHRGIIVELLLTLLIAGRERGLDPQIIALSAVIGDTNGLDRWLDAGILVTTDRPVPLIEGVIDRSGTFQYLDPAGMERTQQLLEPHEVQQRRAEPGAQDVIVPLVRKLAANDETVIVFRNQRGAAEGCAGYLARDLGLPATEDAEKLPELDASSTTATLRECMRRGVAFHNSNLTRDERLVVERAFRRTEGGVRVMAATTTLAAGINTPASTVILAEQEFLGEDGRAFTVAEYKNMAGRAGRPGYGRPGRAIIYAETPHQRVALMERYVKGIPAGVASSFDMSDLDTWVLRLLSQVREVGRDDVSRLLVNTFAGYAATLKNPGWRTEVEERVQATVTEMLELGLLDGEAEFVHLTPLGRACGSSALSFRSALRLVRLLRSLPTAPTARDLMLLVQALPETDATYTPVMARARREKARPQQLAQIVGVQPVRRLELQANDHKTVLQRCKRALVLLDWASGTPTEQIEQRYSTTPRAGKISAGHIRGFADITRFHLRAAAGITQVLFAVGGLSDESVEALLRALELGVPEELQNLLGLRVSLTRGELLALRDAGVNTQAQLWAAPPDRLTEVLGPVRASFLERLRPEA